MKDINKVLCTGTIERKPTMVTLSNGNKLVLFTLISTETWFDKNNVCKSYDNEIDCEVFRDSADWVKENLQVGIRYLVEGFLRTDILNSIKKTRVRVFRVQPLSREDSRFKQAQAILDNSDDLEAAKNKINLL